MSEKPANPTDPLIIRSFIMYEALHKVPVFEAYKKLCKVIGDDVVDYVDYEYWYYRFYNGNLDINYDRSADPKPLTFDDLPADMVMAIVSLLDVQSRLNSQKACERLADAGRQTSKEFKVVAISIEIFKTTLLLDDGLTKYFQQWDNGIERNNSRFEMTENLKSAIEGPKIEIKKFKLSAAPHTRGSYEVIRMLQKIRDESKGEFHVENAKVTVHDVKEAVVLLELLKPRKLKSIKLIACDGSEEMNINDLQAMDQFKMAREIDIRHFAEIDACLIFNHFQHFDYFQIYVYSMTVEQIISLRDMICLETGSAQRKGCTIEVRGSLLSKFDKILEALDGSHRDDARRQSRIIYEHKVANCSEDVFEFEIGEYCISVTRESASERPKKVPAIARPRSDFIPCNMFFPSSSA